MQFKRLDIYKFGRNALWFTCNAQRKNLDMTSKQITKELKFQTMQAIWKAATARQRMRRVVVTFIFVFFGARCRYLLLWIELLQRKIHRRVWILLRTAVAFIQLRLLSPPALSAAGSIAVAHLLQVRHWRFSDPFIFFSIFIIFKCLKRDI